MMLLSRNEEILLLAIWKLEKNAYGVTIRDLISEITGYKWTFGAVYVPLDKLTRKGFIQKTISSPTSKRGGRSKCMYDLTKDGRSALKEIRKVHSALWEGVPEKAFD
ncbi:PadR family transcriptional regulator [Acidobacteriota bacterium]